MGVSNIQTLIEGKKMKDVIQNNEQYPQSF